MSAGIFYFADDGGAFEHYAVAFLWAVLAKFFVEKLLGRPMKYLHFMDIPARPDSEKRRAEKRRASHDFTNITPRIFYIE